MRSFDEWCQFFRDIEKDPSKKVSGLTVRDFLQARAHLYVCEACQESTDRVLKSRSDRTSIDPSSLN